MSRVLDATTLVAALGCALVGGALFTFSSFVMPALARIPDAQGTTAMQSINVTAVRPPFMLPVFGTAALCVALVVVGIVQWGDRRAWLLVAGGVLYLLGTIVVTMAANVPLNDALAAVTAGTAEAEAQWADYLRTWTAWNHVRVVAAMGASGLLVGALTS